MAPRPDVTAERRQQMIEAALACFSRQGYQKTTMDEIAAASGLSKGSLYWYFKSKDELFVAALEAVFQEWGCQAEAAMAAGTSAADRLRRGAEQMAALAQGADGLFALLIEYWSQCRRDDSPAGVWGQMLAAYHDQVAAVIEQGVQRGEFRVADAQQLAWAVLAAYDGLAAYAMLVPDLDVAQVSRVFVETLLRGLQAGA